MTTLTLDWLHVVCLLGALQGVFLTGVLATKRRNRVANRLLAATMFGFSIYLAASAYDSAGFMRVFPHVFGVAYPLPFVFGPLIYLYAINAADRHRGFHWRDTLHFVPVVAVVVLGMPIYLMSGAEKIALYGQLQLGNVPLLIRLMDPWKFVSGVVYTVATISFLQRHREIVKESYSSTEHVSLRWLLWLGAAGAGVWTLAISMHLLQSAGVIQVTNPDDYVSLGIAIVVYGIGYMGLRQPEVFRYETAEYPVQLPVQVPAQPLAAAETVDAQADTAGRYPRPGLTDREAARLTDALTRVMDEERPWKDPELTLADLAARLDTTPHKLSELLNAQLHQSFYEYVNGYRVREVQRRIAAGDARRLKILSLAMDAGFASKSTFNEVFKKHTSQTPSDFRQTVGA